MGAAKRKSCACELVFRRLGDTDSGCTRCAIANGADVRSKLIGVDGFCCDSEVCDRARKGTSVVGRAHSEVVGGGAVVQGDRKRRERLDEKISRASRATKKKEADFDFGAKSSCAEGVAGQNVADRIIEVENA